MRILLVCERLDGRDGWSRYSANLLQALRAKGHAVVAMTVAGGGGDATGLPPPLRVITRPYLAWNIARNIRAAAVRERIDVVHVTVEPYGLAIPLLGRALRGASVLTIHGNYGIRPLRWWASAWLARRMLGTVRRCIAVSAYTRDAVARELGRHGGLRNRFLEKTTVVPNGIPLPPRMDRTARTSGVRRVLFVGAVKGSKGVLEAVRGCAAYRTRYGGTIHFTIAGAAEERSDHVRRLRTLIRELRMYDDVTIAGRVDDATLERLYAEADAFLMPSKTAEDTFEGFGLVYIEANARGVPVIGPDRGGATEAIAEGESGFRIDPDDAEGIAERLHWILDERRITPEQCRRWAELHDASRMAKETIGIYGKLILRQAQDGKWK